MRRRTRLLILSGAAGVAGLAVLSTVPGVRRGAGQMVALLAAGNLPTLRDYLRSFGLWAPLVSVLLMQVQALLAPLPSFPLTYANGLLFGTIRGGLLSWGSVLLSAILCFSLARAFGRPLVERVVSPAALGWVDRWIGRVGPLAVFLARLIPLTSFDALSYAAGLTPMRLWPFCVATGLGVAPGIFLTAAAADLGLDAPWALVGGLLGIAILAGGAALCRPALARALSGSRQTRELPAARPPG
jgi:uncharacterized membrane protein YdjX (TVP38/TMEM64 family)